MKTVSIVLVNADFTEGRGPMLFHKVFSTKEKAFDYVRKQEGIFGSKQKETPDSYTNNEFWFNGYTVLTNRKVDE